MISSPLVPRTKDQESDLFCLPLFLSHSSPLQRRSFSFGIPLFHAEVWEGREQVRATESLAAGWMGSDSIECVSSIDEMDEEDTALTQSSKPHGGAAPPAGFTPSTSVHELLECPVCANSMYPPIHQVDSFPLFQLIFWWSCDLAAYSGIWFMRCGLAMAIFDGVIGSNAAT